MLPRYPPPACQQKTRLGQTPSAPPKMRVMPKPIGCMENKHARESPAKRPRRRRPHEAPWWTPPARLRPTAFAHCGAGLTPRRIPPMRNRLKAERQRPRWPSRVVFYESRGIARCLIHPKTPCAQRLPRKKPVLISPSFPAEKLTTMLLGVTVGHCSK